MVKGKTHLKFVGGAVETSTFWLKFGTRILATLRAEIAGDAFTMACGHGSTNRILLEVVKKSGLRIQEGQCWASPQGPISAA